MVYQFVALLNLIGINPFVFVPEEILDAIFRESGKNKGHIPVCGNVNGKPYQQTLVKYKGSWRLYINTLMLEKSPQRIEEEMEISIAIDPSDRTLSPPPRFTEILKQHPVAQKNYESLPPSHRKEIVRYLLSLKPETAFERNLIRVKEYLEGKTRFVGRMPVCGKGN